MNAWKHSLSSQKTFGGSTEDYLSIHQFLDSSKLFHYHLKHRALLHHLLGIEYCEDLFGTVLKNAEGKHIPVREIAAQHIREDLSGHLPTVNEWFEESDQQICGLLIVPNFEETQLEEFVLKPYIRSGLKSALMITCSQFGIALAHRLKGWEFAKALAGLIPPTNHPKTLMKGLRLSYRWQYTPDKRELDRIKNIENSNEQ